MAGFKLKSEYKPAGDQPKAIAGLVDGLKAGERFQTLLGVTGWTAGRCLLFLVLALLFGHVGRWTLDVGRLQTLALDGRKQKKRKSKKRKR